MFIVFIIVELVLMGVVYFKGYNKGYDDCKEEDLQIVNKAKKIVNVALDN